MSDLYLECGAGISGDMAVAALLDLGADRTALQQALDSIPAHGFKTEITRVSKGGIDCCDFNVVLDSDHENHDHDMEYLFGHESRNGNGDSHHHHKEELHDGEHFPRHDEEPGHHHVEHGHHHEHRNLADVLSIIDGTRMTDGARKLAHRIFQIIAEAESKAHGLPLDKVHFHEVGAIDSVVDVIALSVCFDSLNVGRVFVPFLNEGSGTVRCQHGILPVPVPAVANIAQSYGLPLHIMQNMGEFVTPTGAAFAAAVMTDKVLPESFEIKRTGLGAGKRTYSRPSILRAFIIEENDKSSDKVVKLETNIDDCTGESLGFVMDALLKGGALDVNYVPCFMKKNRPAYLLTVICREAGRGKLEEIIFRNTTTIGIRRSVMERTVLERREVEVSSPYGKIRAKEVRGNGVHRILPEYDDAAEIAAKTGKPFGEIYAELLDLCRKA